MPAMLVQRHRARIAVPSSFELIVLLSFWAVRYDNAEPCNQLLLKLPWLDYGQVCSRAAESDAFNHKIYRQPNGMQVGLT